MKWINNIRVAYKILILVVISAIAMTTISYGGYGAIDKGNEYLGEMYNQKLNSVRLTSEVETSMRELQVRAVLSMNAVDDKRRQELANDFKKSSEIFHKRWSDYKDLVRKVPGLEEKLAAVDRDSKTFEDTMQQVIALGAGGHPEEALALYNSQGIKTTKVLREELTELKDRAVANAKMIYETNDEASKAASRNMLLKSLLALLVLLITALWISREITRPLRTMMEVCGKLRDGDFRDVPRQVIRGDEFGQMADVIAAMRTNMNKLMHHTSNSSEQIAASSEELMASSSQSAEASAQVAQSVTNAAEAVALQQNGVEASTQSVHTASNTVGAIRDEVDQVAERASAAFEQAVQGSRAIHTSVAQIRNVENTVRDSAAIVDKLGERSKEIGQIVETISGIAGQTNLLALNAAIEAARAGEHGRGFAVVAEEVRKLAEESETAAGKIAELIVSIQSDTTNAVSSMRQGSQAVSEGAASVEQLREGFETIRRLVDEVSQAVSSMASGIKQVVDDTQHIADQIEKIDMQGSKVSDEMQSVSAATEEQSASAQEIASASDSLAKLAQDLQTSLQKFQF